MERAASCEKEHRKLAAHGKWTCDGAALCVPGKGRVGSKVGGQAMTLQGMQDGSMEWKYEPRRLNGQKRFPVEDYRRKARVRIARSRKTKALNL